MMKKQTMTRCLPLYSPDSCPHLLTSNSLLHPSPPSTPHPSLHLLPQARNALESFVFETQDFLYSEEAAKVSTEDQRAAMLETLSQASEWMFEEGDGAETKVGEGVGCHNNIVLTAIMFSANMLAGIAPLTFM